MGVKMEMNIGEKNCSTVEKKAIWHRRFLQRRAGITLGLPTNRTINTNSMNMSQTTATGREDACVAEGEARRVVDGSDGP
jgi:hypothetical protein